MNTNDIPAVPFQLSRGIVVASVQVDLNDEVMSRFREDLLYRVEATGTPGVILDLSGLETMDSHEFSALRQLVSMIEIMGSRAILVGLRPGVVSSLIEAGAEVDGLDTALDLDAAFAMLQIDVPEHNGDSSVTVPLPEDSADFGVPVVGEAAPVSDL